MGVMVAKVKSYLPFALTALILGVIIYRIDWAHFYQLLIHQNVTMIGLCLLSLVGQILFLAARWDSLINVTRHKISAKDTFRMTFISLMSNFIFLTSISGTVLRLVMTVNHGVPWVRAVCASLTDRVFSLMGLVVLGLVFSPYLLNMFEFNFVRPIFLLSFICVTLVAIVLAAIFLPKTRYARMLKKHHLARKVIIYLQRLVMGRALATVTLYTVAGQLCFFMAVFFVLLSSGTAVGFLPLMMVLPLISIVAALPISAGGWGVREGAFIVGLSTLGLSNEVALLASLQIGVFGMLASLMMGLPCLFSKRMQMSLKESVTGSVAILKRLRA